MVCFNIYIYLSFVREKRRNRVLQAFIAGIIRAISDYKSRLDVSTDSDKLPEKHTNIPIPYEELIEDIRWEFDEDFFKNYKSVSENNIVVEPFSSWLRFEKNLFFDFKYNNEGFCMMYYDFHDWRNKLWHTPSDGINISKKEHAYLRNDIKITKENVDEMKGEIAMFKNVVNGKLDNSSFTPENIDLKLSVIFNHIDEGKRQEAKEIILGRLKQK